MAMCEPFWDPNFARRHQFESINNFRNRSRLLIYFAFDDCRGGPMCPPSDGRTRGCAPTGFTPCTLAKNKVRLEGVEKSEFYLLTEPTEIQARAFELLEV